MRHRPKEFDCIDCGDHVVSWAATVHANDQPICGTCAWVRYTLAQIEDPVERERTRVTLRSFIRGKEEKI